MVVTAVAVAAVLWVVAMLRQAAYAPAYKCEWCGRPVPCGSRFVYAEHGFGESAVEHKVCKDCLNKKWNEISENL